MTLLTFSYLGNCDILGNKIFEMLLKWLLICFMIKELFHVSTFYDMDFLPGFDDSAWLIWVTDSSGIKIPKGCKLVKYHYFHQMAVY